MVLKYGLALPGGQRYDWTAWTDDLPAFAPMALADGTPSSGNVRLPGYAHISAIPRLFEATGTIDSTRRETDGTMILNMRFTNPDASGGSGGPILDTQNRVVGMNAWNDADPSIGHGEGVEVLHKPCGSATF